MSPILFMQYFFLIFSEKTKDWVTIFVSPYISRSKKTLLSLSFSPGLNLNSCTTQWAERKNLHYAWEFITHFVEPFYVLIFFLLVSSSMAEQRRMGLLKNQKVCSWRSHTYRIGRVQLNHGRLRCFPKLLHRHRLRWEVKVTTSQGLEIGWISSRRRPLNVSVKRHTRGWM